MEKLLILSDIHGNLTALDQVLGSASLHSVDHIIMLGDLIDYGPRSNEVIERIGKLDKEKILVNIWGNHEHAIMEEDYGKFSSDRGRLCAQYTKSILTGESRMYLGNMNKDGWQEFEVRGRHCLAVHGSLEDVFWKSIDSCAGGQYAQYDYVFSGHSHIPSYVEKFYNCDNRKYRNKKKTVFLNPGSVGQPRNHNPDANYAILEIESGTIMLQSVPYDYKKEMELFSNQVDAFYKKRLSVGI